MVAIAHPRAVIDALPHRLGVLAVARNIDADLRLTANDIRHRVSQICLERGVVDLLAAEQRQKPQPTKTVYAKGSMEWFAEQKKSG
jgi:hypothetical protein